MEIASIAVYQVDLPLHEGSYKWSGGRSVEVFDSTVVQITTKNGTTGIGEFCPLGPFYLPAFAGGARAAIRDVLGPALLGVAANQLGRVNQVMDAALLGHEYAKSALDIACWDITGKHLGCSVVELLGARYEKVALYRAISQASAADMASNIDKYRAEGYTKFQLKLGSTVQEDVARVHLACEQLRPGEVLVGDANCGWNSAQALQVARACVHPQFYLEQPCRTYEECLVVRQRFSGPFILDESIHDVRCLLRAHRDGACDGINLKIGKVGGLTKAKQIRDLAVTFNMLMCIEDSWGGDVVTAAIASLAQSTPVANRLSSTDFNSYVTVSFAIGAPQRTGGFMEASQEAGLGVQLSHVVGEPHFIVK